MEIQEKSEPEEKAERMRKATMAKRMMNVMVGVVRFMVVWLEI